MLNLREKPEKILLRTMSENPAFEWNSRSQPKMTSESTPALYPILQGVNTKVNFAPAIVYRKCNETNVQEHLVAGISVEVNTSSDVRLYLGLKQLDLFRSLVQQAYELNCQLQGNASSEHSTECLSEISVPAEILVTCNSIKVLLYNEGPMYITPLMLMSVMHPHMFMVFSPVREKMTFSLYTLEVCTPNEDDVIPSQSLLNEASFPNVILESRAGTADLSSGIKPPFMKTVVEGFLGHTVSININIGRPVNGYGDPQTISQVLLCSTQFLGDTTTDTRNEPLSNSRIKHLKVEMSTKPCKLVLNTNSLKHLGMEVSLSLIGASFTLAFGDLVKIKCDLSCKNLNSTLHIRKRKHSLFGPMDLNITGDLSHDPCEGPKDGFVMVTLGRTSLHIGPDHVTALLHIFEVINDIFLFSKKESVVKKSSDVVDDRGEHFCDDLRLGTFTIEDTATDSDIPQPYRIMFNRNSLTWTYPRPRTLTKMLILPMPLTLADSGSSGAGDRVSCQLQYWSSNRSAWSLYQHFVLEEGAVTHVDLPICTDRRSCEFANTWRIQMFSEGNIRDEIPCSLISALRVDSFFSSAMLPNFQVVLRSDHLDVQVHNHLYNQGLELNDCFKDLFVDDSYPKDQSFMSLNLDSFSTELSVWTNSPENSMLKMTSRSRVGVDFIDYCYLANHTLLKPCDAVIKVQMQSKSIDVFADLGKAEIMLGPFGIHTFVQSAKLWEQALNDESKSLPFIPVTQILVINDTCEPLTFGQSGTDEVIHIESKVLVMYTWRSQKAGNTLRLRTSKQGAKWSDSFSLVVGESFITLEDGRVISVSVEKTSSSLMVATLKGLITVVNLLKDHLEIKLVNARSESPKILSGSCERPVSFITKPGDLDIKIKLFGLFTAWSMGFSLNNTRKHSLIRLPHREKGNCLTVWCNIITSDTLEPHTNLLVVFSPMYVVDSQIPGMLQVHAQLEDRQTEVLSQAFGTCCQIDLQQAPENKFNLSFQLSPESIPSSPPVSVSWGIIDQVRTSKKEEKTFNTEMKEIIDICRSKMNSQLLLKDLSDMKTGEQFGSDCRVTFEEVHPALNTLKIKVQSKQIFINKTEKHLVLNCGKDDWFIEPSSVFYPPPIFSAFKIGILLREGEEYLGPSMEITDHDWTYVSLLPNRDRVIPKYGDLIYNVKCGNKGMMLNIHSQIIDGVRIITMQSMFLFTNQLDTKIKIKPGMSFRKSLSISNASEPKEDELVWDLEASSEGQGLLWSLLDKGDGSPEFCVRLGQAGSNWSRELSIPADDDKRQCFCLYSPESALPCILTSYRLEGQVYVVIFKDERPQFKLTNGLDVDIKFKEVTGLPYYLDKGSETFYTCKYVEDGYPLVEEDPENNRIHFSLPSVDGSGRFLFGIS